MARRAVVLMLALLTVSAAAEPLPKCVWAIGVCNASPGNVLSQLDSLVATTPQSEGMMRVFAMEAVCHSKLDKAACAEAKMCSWSSKEAPACTANLEKMGDVIDNMPALTGCPGSESQSIAVCAAAKTYDACLALPAKCGWLESDSIPAATEPGVARPGAERRKRFVRRRLADVSPMMRSNTTADMAIEELVAGPNGAPLAGCLPARAAALAAALDVKALEALIFQYDDRDPAVYGTCEMAPGDLMERCNAASTVKLCAKRKECEWDAEGAECYAGQAAMMAAMPDVGARASAASAACRKLATAEACGAAGSLDFDLARLTPLLPARQAVVTALATPDGGTFKQFV